MSQLAFSLDIYVWRFTVAACVLVCIYVITQRAYPRPIPGIPYNTKAQGRLIGDLAELQERQKAGGSIRPWFLEQAQRHKSAIVQIFLGPFAKPAVLISDYREVQDILTYRDADFKRGKKVDVFIGVLPEAFPSMESFNPMFKSTRDLMRDLMTPSFLHRVSAPRTYEVTKRLLQLWKLKTQMAEGRPFDVSNDIVKFSFDAILSAAIGLADEGDLGSELAHLNAVKKTVRYLPETLSNGDPITFPSTKRSDELSALSIDEKTLWKGFYMPWPRLYHVLNKLRPTVRQARQTIRGLIQSRIAKSMPNLEKGNEPQCALDYLVRREVKVAQSTGREPKVDDSRIRDGVYGYLIAGHDTSAGSLKWLLRRLVSHSNEQRKIRENLWETYTAARAESRLPTAAELVKTSPYLDAFVEEVLRVNCPVVTIAIHTRKDTMILGHHVPVETPVFLNLTGPCLNMPSIPVEEAVRSETSRVRPRTRANWDDSGPNVFHPERWLRYDHNGKLVFNASSGPTLSFSAGDRGCWGKRLGYLELRITLSLLVWTFHFDEVPGGLNTLETYDSLVTAPKRCFLRLREIRPVACQALGMGS